MDSTQLADTFAELIAWLRSEEKLERMIGDKMDTWSPEDNWATADTYLTVIDWLEKKGIK